MDYTQPRQPTFSESCTASSVVDQSRQAAYKLAPAPGASIDRLAPGEPGVVEDQSAYPSQVVYSDLPRGSKSEWRLVPLLRAAAAPGTGPTPGSTWIGDFTGAGSAEVLVYDNQYWWLGSFRGGAPTWVLANVTTFGPNALIWRGRFAGTPQSQMLVYDATNWWLGSFRGNYLNWTSLQLQYSPSSGFVPTGLTWIGVFAGTKDPQHFPPRSQVLCYSADNGSWWHGATNGTILDFAQVASHSGGTSGGPPDPSSTEFTWVADFIGDSLDQLLYFTEDAGTPPMSQHWWLSTIDQNGLSWRDVQADFSIFSGPTYTFGDPTWVGEFTGVGRSELLLYSTVDQRWWLATFEVTLPMSWSQIGSTSGPQAVNLDSSWVGDFTGEGHSELLVFSPSDQNWWLGKLSTNDLGWDLVGNTSGFGDTSRYPTWIGNFTGSGRSQVLFYSPGDNHWWLGSFTGSRLTWALVGGPLDVTNPYPGWDQRTPLDTLRAAAKLLKKSGGQLQDQHQIRALADLAVTGRFAYEALAAMQFIEPADVALAMNLGGEYADAAMQVARRAQQVAWAIRGDPSWRHALRPRLGWIGVSGEDDAPHRPCNVYSLMTPQFDIQVPVGGRTYTTRITITEEWKPNPAPPRDVVPLTFLPPDQVPQVSPDSDYVIVYMPGDTSRIEEAADLIPALFQVAAERGKKITILVFDLIGWGYSGRRVIDHDGNPLPFDQTLFPTVTYPADPPALQFVEEFVVALLETLHNGPPYIDLNKVVPVGGSLGGNLALRLGRRTGVPWLHAVCGWSAGSVWPSKASNPGPDTGPAIVFGTVAGTVAGAAVGGVVGSFLPGSILPGPIEGVVVGGIVGGAAGTVAGVVKGPSIDPTIIQTATDNMNQLEDPTQRKQHFVGVFDKDTFNVAGIPIVPPQATMWYRGDWAPCKVNYMVQDRLDRRETYDQTLRRWHWRISLDQLVYSHRDPDPTRGVPRYLLNKVPMLLAAGADDNYQFFNIKYAAIYDFTRDLASKMTVAGTSLFLLTTGHSIHNERPVELAHAIFDFLGTVTRTSTDLSYLFPLLLDDQV